MPTLVTQLTKCVQQRPLAHYRHRSAVSWTFGCTELAVAWLAKLNHLVHEASSTYRLSDPRSIVALIKIREGIHEHLSRYRRRSSHVSQSQIVFRLVVSDCTANIPH